MLAQQLEELIAFVQPDDLPTLAASFKSSPEKFRCQLAAYIILEACRGLTPAQISQHLDAQEIRIHRDNISFLLATWDDLQRFSPEVLRTMRQEGEDERGESHDDSDIAIRLELAVKRVHQSPEEIPRRLLTVRESQWR